MQLKRTFIVTSDDKEYRVWLEEYKLEWELDAKCSPENLATINSQRNRLGLSPILPDDFYPDSENVASPEVKKAKSVCLHCPVALQCLTYAIVMEQLEPSTRHGIWGGLTKKERARLRADLEDSPTVHVSDLQAAQEQALGADLTTST